MKNFIPPVDVAAYLGLIVSLVCLGLGIAAFSMAAAALEVCHR